jgi:uncharacterized membrane protein
MTMVERLVPWVTGGLEIAGITATLLGTLAATIVAARQIREPGGVPMGLYENYRRQLSRGILLGLEFLVAADIIGTVAVEPTFRSVGILGLIVLIRTFLSFTLEVEIAGHWPWQVPTNPAAAAPQPLTGATSDDRSTHGPEKSRWHPTY